MSSDGDYSTAKESQFDDTSSIFSDAAPRHGVPTSSRRGRTTNTGPKGVRADARAYEASKRDATVINKLKNMMNRKTVMESGNESSSDADEDKWMSRWREQRMKELSKTGVAGVNLFGQVDDVDARGYLAAVDYEDSDSPDDNLVAAKRGRARRNVVSVVLIYDNVWHSWGWLMVVFRFKEFVSVVFGSCETTSYDTFSTAAGAGGGGYVVYVAASNPSIPTRWINRQPSQFRRRTPVGTTR